MRLYIVPRHIIRIVASSVPKVMQDLDLLSRTELASNAIRHLESLVHIWGADSTNVIEE